MNSRIMQIFYGNDCLPYKDKERTVHYPIVGQAFQGASDTTEVRFYYGSLGDVNTSWVCVSKLPNGKVGSKVLTKTFDEELNEYYVSLELSSYYTQAKGDLYLSLQGYAGGVVVQEIEGDSENETIYQIVGTPTIQATGSVKITIAYATQFIGGDETENITYQELLALIGEKANDDIVVKRIPSASVINDAQYTYAEIGDIVYVEDEQYIGVVAQNGTAKKITRKVDGSLQLYEVDNHDNLFNVSTIFGETPFIAKDTANNYYYVKFSSDSSYLYVFIYDLTSNTYYTNKYANANLLSTNFDDLLQDSLEVAKHNIPTIEINSSSGTLSQSDYEIVKQIPSNIIYVVGNYNDLFVHCYDDENYMYFMEILTDQIENEGSFCIFYNTYIKVNKTTLEYDFNNDDEIYLYNKAQVDSIVATLKANSFKVVDSLPATGEEGIIYLVPISGGEGYTQYIYESGAYINLGDTTLDLSDYYTKTQTDTLLGGKLDKSTSQNTLYGVNGSGNQTQYIFGSAVGNNYIVQRNGSGQVLVPQTPTDNAHATSKKYVDDALSLKANSSDVVAKTFTIAGVDMQDNITSQELTDALTYMNTTTDITYVMED